VADKDHHIIDFAIDNDNKIVIINLIEGGHSRFKLLSTDNLELIKDLGTTALQSSIIYLEERKKLITKEIHSNLIKKINCGPDSIQKKFKLISSINAAESKVDNPPFEYDSKRNLLFYGHSSGVMAINVG